MHPEVAAVECSRLEFALMNIGHTGSALDEGGAHLRARFGGQSARFACFAVHQKQVAVAFIGVHIIADYAIGHPSAFVGVVEANTAQLPEQFRSHYLLGRGERRGQR